MKRKYLIAGVVISSVALIGYVGFGVKHLVSSQTKLQHSEVKLEQKSTEYYKLQLDYKTLNGKLQQELQKNQTDDATMQKLQQEKDELDRRNKELEQLSAAKAAEKARIAAAASKAVNAVTGSGTAYAASSDSDKAFIYQHESGNRTDAINPGSGACGLGQALPCSKMGCSLSDYACQDAWFTNYAMQRYGSWANARAFWEAHRWW